MISEKCGEQHVIHGLQEVIVKEDQHYGNVKRSFDYI
jgi:hypothetical protein